MLDKIYKVLYFHLYYQYTDKHLVENYLFFPANGMNKCIYTNLFAIWFFLRLLHLHLGSFCVCGSFASSAQRDFYLLFHLCQLIELQNYLKLCIC